MKAEMMVLSQMGHSEGGNYVWGMLGKVQGHSLAQSAGRRLRYRNRTSRRWKVPREAHQN